MVVVPPHEQLHAEVEANPQILDDLKKAVEQNDLAPIYFAHPVAAASGNTAVPLAIYLDGVPFVKNDNVLGVWTVNLISGVRYLSAVCRKSKMCRCGCKYWCSLYAVLRWLCWSLAALADGKHPETRHDGSAFNDSDSRRPENILQVRPLGFGHVS